MGMERRLQTLVFKLRLAKSIHHARVLIRQRHIRVGKQLVNVPSFLVRLTPSAISASPRTRPSAPAARAVLLARSAPTLLTTARTRIRRAPHLPTIGFL